MRLATLFFTLFFLLRLDTAYGMNDKVQPLTVHIGTEHIIDSKYLKESRPIIIHLPKSYNNTDQSYPVIYLLDGENHIAHSVTSIDKLSDENLVSEAIVVAIPNLENTRARDLVKNRQNFINFIKFEVLEFIGRNFRANDNSTIFGHSGSGGFLFYLLTNGYQELFDNYIAASPAIGDKTLQRFEKNLQDNILTHSTLYFTVGNEIAEREYINPAVIQSLANILQRENKVKLKWTFETFKEQNHMTTPTLTFYRGIATIFGSL